MENIMVFDFEKSLHKMLNFKPYFIAQCYVIVTMTRCR